MNGGSGRGATELLELTARRLPGCGFPRSAQFPNFSPYLQAVAYLGGAITPHSLHLLRFSSAIHALIYGLSCNPKFTTWKTSSRMIVGFLCIGFLQYHRRRSNGSVPLNKRKNQSVGLLNPPKEASGRVLSITIPTVLGNRTGL